MPNMLNNIINNFVLTKTNTIFVLKLETMSEIKTIKGKVLFCVIPIIGDQVSDEYYSEWLTMVTKQELGESFRLSTITEKQASLLVESVEHEYLCGGTSIDYKEYFGSMAGIYSFNTAKKSLLNLLEGNGCWVKGIQREVQKNDFCYFFDQDRLRRDIEAYENAADDYLLIIKQ